ncbi:MAG: glycosyltransferase family 2 protein [Roseiflexaceae bacterium]
MTITLSVAIIARDEERHIGAALASVAGLADEALVLLDERTSDGTAAIARAHGARVLAEPWRGFPAQRNRALELCGSDWVLFLDADERVAPELATEIAQTLCNADRQVAGYWIPRHNQFFGRVARGGGWYPDEQLRLLRRGRARYDEQRLVHETVELDGPDGHLRGHLLHLNIERLDELLRKQRSYAIQEAQTLYLAGRRARKRNFAGAPLREFRRRYLALGGWRDGALGLLLCGTLALFELVKFLHLKGLEQAAARPREL